MTNNEILKVIEMINNNQTNEAKEFLQTQLVKATDKKAYNILTLVKKFLTNAKKINSNRTTLTTIQHNGKGEQFIVDGFVAVKFKQHETALDSLEQTPSEQSLNIEAIFSTQPNYTLTDNDKVIINNIDEIINLDKATNTENRSTCVVNLFGKYFDLNVIKNALKILLAYSTNLDNTNFRTNDNVLNAIEIENDKVKILALPCRYTNEEAQNKVKELTQQYLNIIKGV